MLNFVLIAFLSLSLSSPIKEKIELYLNAQLAGYQKFEFEIINAPKGIENSIIDENREFKLNGDIGFIPVNKLNGNSSSLSFITVKLKLFNNVLIAKKDLHKKQLLTEDDFEFKLKDVSKLNGTPILMNANLNSFRTKTVINRGHVLIEEYCEKTPIVKSGDQLYAHSGYGNVEITLDAVARQDGGENDIIRIVTKDRKQYKARVIDSQNVLILE